MLVGIVMTLVIINSAEEVFAFVVNLCCLNYVCAAEVESNLLAMGFKVTSDCATVQLPDRPTTVQQSSINTYHTSVPLKSTGSSTLRSHAETPAVRNVEHNGAAGMDAKVTAVDAANSSKQSLYTIIRQRSQAKLSTQEERPTTLSSGANSVLTRSPGAAGTQHPQRESSVKFCLEKNAFISASSAEESQCR